MYERQVTTVKKWKNKESRLTCEVVKHFQPEFRHDGKCYVPERTHYCGYVYFKRLPWMTNWEECEFSEFVNVHGGITWLREDDGIVKMGFDTCHYGDFGEDYMSGKTIWSDEMAICETNHMAIQVGRLLESKNE